MNEQHGLHSAIQKEAYQGLQLPPEQKKSMQVSIPSAALHTALPSLTWSQAIFSSSHKQSATSNILALKPASQAPSRHVLILHFSKPFLYCLP